ncbi:MAG: AraC family transcriptional regulator [Chitinophagaceae bacterium]|nr:AraC family transcriptional regulator [Anaerolineae bacterium]
MDALKHVLQLLRLKAKLFYRMELAAPWGMALAVSNAAAFHVVEYGQCWLRLSDHKDPILLGQGDLVVISNQAHYEVVDDLKTDVIPLREFVRGRKEHGITCPSASKPHIATLICGEFRTENEAVYPLFSLLPPLILIKGEAGQSAEWLTAALRFIASEAADARPGSETVISRLMDILFIMVMRYWIDHHASSDGGWLGALYHPQMGKILGYIHREPQRDWTVESLAEAVQMARSTLAAQFTAMIGEPPMKYLTRWRMQVAAMLLMDNPMLTVEAVALRVGYTSPYAFSKAFKRLIGLAPSDFRAKYQAIDSPSF